MSRLRFTQSPLRALERRLARARPQPDREFTRRTERALGARWATLERPAALRLQVLALLLAGVALFIIALALALS